MKFDETCVKVAEYIREHGHASHVAERSGGAVCIVGAACRVLLGEKLSGTNCNDLLMYGFAHGFRLNVCGMGAAEYNDKHTTEEVLAALDTLGSGGFVIHCGGMYTPPVE